jgi:hypothetical protein
MGSLPSSVKFNVEKEYYPRRAGNSRGNRQQPGGDFEEKELTTYHISANIEICPGVKQQRQDRTR